jgi:hypothetical protein
MKRQRKPPSVEYWSAGRFFVMGGAIVHDCFRLPARFYERLNGYLVWCHIVRQIAVGALRILYRMPINRFNAKLCSQFVLAIAFIPVAMITTD